MSARPEHTAFLKTRIGVNTLAAIVTVSTALWYALLLVRCFVDFGGKTGLLELPTIWCEVFIGLPFVSVIFASLFGHVYLRDGCERGLLFWSVIAFGLSPWLLCLVPILLG